MNKHTKGPWITESRYKTAINAGKKHIAMVNQYKSGDPESDVWGDEHEANAQLIAAAPDLLEALLDMISAMESYCYPHSPEIITARAAITKATQPITKE